MTCFVYPPQYPENVFVYDEDTQKWRFHDYLHTQSSDFFKPLLLRNTLLELEYKTLCSRLAQDLSSPKKQADSKSTLVSALMIADLLEFHFTYYLDVPHQAKFYHQERRKLQYYLRARGMRFSEAPPLSNHNQPRADFISQTIRQKTGAWNIIRTSTQRSRRLLVEIMRFAGAATTLQSLVLAVDPYLRPTINYLVWLFFIPRLCNNLAIVLKHSIPGFGMTEKEKELDLLTRIHLQFDRRGFELFDDVCWFFVNTAICTIATGSLLHWALWVTITQQILEVISRTGQAWYKIKEMHDAQNAYQARLDDPTLSDNDKQTLRLFIDDMTQTIRHEQTLLYTNILNSCVQLSSFLLAIPLLAFNPWFALAGAGLSVTGTILFHYLGDYLKHQNPNTPLPEPEPPEKDKSPLRRYGMFETVKEEDCNEKHAQLPTLANPSHSLIRSA